MEDPQGTFFPFCSHNIIYLIQPGILSVPEPGQSYQTRRLYGNSSRGLDISLVGLYSSGPLPIIHRLNRSSKEITPPMMTRRCLNVSLRTMVRNVESGDCRDKERTLKSM